MALGSFVAGRYVASYDPPGAATAADLGITQDGWQLFLSYAKQLVQTTDAYGDTVIEAIGRGISNCRLDALALEWKVGVLTALFPYQTTPPGITGAGVIELGTIGTLDSAKGGILILTATAGTPAAASPATVTATQAAIRENNDIQIAFDSRLRTIPLSFRVFPYLDSVVKFVTLT